MKKLYTFILIFCLLFAFDSKANSISYTQKLNFGKLVPTATSGNIVMSNAGSVSGSSGVQIIQNGISGMFDYEASGLLGIISLTVVLNFVQSSVTLTSSYPGAPAITVTNFVANPNKAILELNLFGVDLKNVRVGGTLNFTGTPRGTYTGSVRVQVYKTGGLTGFAEGTIPIEVTFLKPLGATQVSQLNFGAINVTSSSIGTVRMLPNGTRSVLSGIDLGLASNAGPATAGSFDISGEPNQLVNIVLPGSVTLSNENSKTIMLSYFSRQPSGSITLNGSGDANLKIGADVAIATGQASGTYTGTYTIQINY